MRVGRAADMKIIEPAEMGEIWMKIPLTSEDIHVYVDKQKQNSVSFVFNQRPYSCVVGISMRRRLNGESG